MMCRAVLLDRYLDEYPRFCFDWSTANCCHFVAKWVELITGHYPMQGLPLTQDYKAARRLVKKMGGTLESAWTLGMNAPTINPNLAQIGDVMLVPLLKEDSSHGVGALVGICTGRHVLCLDDKGEPARILRAHSTHAWRTEAPKC